MFRVARCGRSSGDWKTASEYRVRMVSGYDDKKLFFEAR